MAASVSDRFDIDATPEQVMRALEDVERIPEWSSAHKSVEVLTRDDDGRPIRIRMTLSLLGFSDTQIIEHSWTETSTSWTLVESSMQRSQDGEYALEPTERGTRVHVTMSLEPKVPVPGFVLKRGQKHAVEAVRKGLTEFVLSNYA
ncbi:Polyketide cyclase / dehydrase and lipid transport [Rhodococcus rhodochrous]|uniref:SRPBCC family protein n=1 Tax=Rhodococcus TaxID=1827 RepID=UPI000751666F|nr:MULTISPECIES: SRPBCC family protein [Rhodococcus]MDC3727372.1 SRPBCC family protein [Rhodococcus sp. Rp3]MDO1485582.1 SRPBCC family protein [Rhodococcus rhodochrous]MXQ75108.1 cyclase [Rhodococcus rhodochrous]TWH37970.1 polyketide cyclase/dehydrase/lipid transport protein [Rhodococcus rhodochrous J38]SNV24949.1 Polyketide cyclase / dehydrase and lipid transport [Rhodococcus rhodochrous]